RKSSLIPARSMTRGAHARRATSGGSLPSLMAGGTMRNIGISLLAAAALSLPAAAKSSVKAEVTCNDGTTAKAGRGARSRHGGVAKPPGNKPPAEPDDGKKETEKKSGGILDTLFGRKKDETAQGR